MMINQRKLKRLIEEAHEKCEEFKTAEKKLEFLKERLLDVIEELEFKFIKRPIYKFKKLMRWIPIIWKDEDWDYYHLLYIVKEKIQDMKNCIVEENIIVPEDLEAIKKSIDETCEHIHNYANDYEVFNKRNPLPFNLGYRNEPTPDGNGYRMLNWNEDEDRPLNEEEEEIYKKHLHALWKFENDEWEAIWDTIKEHGRSWWD